MPKMKILCVVSSVSLVASLAAPAAAQVTPDAVAEGKTEPMPPTTESNDFDPNEIVVTAQHREERLQDVPIAVAALSSAQLDASNVRDLFDIALVAPGVKIQQYNGLIFPMIRGVSAKTAGAGIDLPISTYVDGVYIGSPHSSTISFNSIERIEILKGPQGTLFGRNATGGLIQIVTRDPQHALGGKVDLTYANFGTIRGQAYATGGLANNLAMDIAFGLQGQANGWGKNIATGQDANKLDHELSLRSKMLFTPKDGLAIRLTGDYFEQHNSRYAAQRPEFGVIPPAPFGPPFSGGDFDIASDQQPDFQGRGGGASLRIDYEFEKIALASISAYRENSYEQVFDSDYTAYPGRIADVRASDKQFSQEIQILSNDDGWLNWTVGGFYYWSLGKFDPIGTITFGPSGVPGLPGPATGRFAKVDLKTDSIAAYGQATAEVTDRLRFTLGLRYTHEKKTLLSSGFLVSPSGTTTITTPESTRSASFNKLTWRASVDYNIAKDSMIYASFNRGFRSGGFNTLVITLPPFEPETLDAYEIGIKNKFNGWLTVNAAAYYYDYKDIQVGRSVNGLTGTFNAPGTEIYGVDLEFFARVSERIRFSGGYSYVHGRYLDFPGAPIATPLPSGGYTVALGNVRGNTTILSPEHSLSFATDFTVPLHNAELKFNANYSYTSRYFHEPDNVLEQPAYSMLGASVSYESDDGFTLSLWGKNLTNKAIQVVGGVQTFGTLGFARASYGEPRTYGVTASFRY